MSLCYILDGYNITNQMPSLALRHLKVGREGLLSLIEIYRPQGSIKNSVTVVFDGQPGILGDVQSSCVKAIFTREESADDKIRSLVAEAKNKKRIIVVTDDKELKFSVRALGAGVLSVQEFLVKIQPDKEKTGGVSLKKDEDKKVISKTTEYKITKELEKIWLKET